ncbi:MAG: phosphoribosylanthranilate isomerase [Cyanobacteria bacterium J083]|nr:MAG: phosphoribosylanthranilate isomerase [Cyanobacteria bacterium J083]
MRIKICGITQISQAQKIAQLGATALGFICVTQSPRYVKPSKLKKIVANLPPEVDKIGVFANSPLAEIAQLAQTTDLTGIQLHGNESREFCQQLRQKLTPSIEIIKAFRIHTPESLLLTEAYFPVVDTLLLDAYHPHLLGGTGKTIDWQILRRFNPPLPWILAGGLNPDNVRRALIAISPDGIDLSSGVERSPGDKNLSLVSKLFNNLAS